jgi:two-component system CheB/CheR fusion protein
MRRRPACESGNPPTIGALPARAAGRERRPLMAEAPDDGAAMPVDALVVVGSSAGGVEALSALVAGLPRDLPAPLILAQHLDPRRPSRLGEILARRSTLPVRVVEDHAPLAPGVVYVVPSNHHVTVTDHAVALLGDGADRPVPSVDLLLASAAEVFGERLVAVILTGTGRDGAEGARAVKAAGGTVLIQDPTTAAFPGMPLALAPTTVDIAAPVERIGPLLGELLAGGVVPAGRPEEERPLDAVLEAVRERVGIDFGAYKRPTLLRRLRRRVAATGAGDLAGYLAHLGAHPEEYQHLASAFLIKVTDFFRDPALFAALGDAVLPALLDRAARRGEPLRVWSAGCATGEEAYSLAILVAEALGPALEESGARIFATDLDADAVAYARRGLYPPAALGALPPALVERHFLREDDGYRVRKRLRNLLVFGQHDLGQRAPFPRLDLVLCRNVLIYFTPALQRRALQVFAFALRDGGVLALGRAEGVGPAAEYFAPDHPTQKLYRRTGERIPLLLGTAARTPAAGPPRLPRRAPDRPAASVPARSRGESYLLRLPVGVVVVDRRYDVREINGAARRLLGIHSPALGEDLIHLAQGLPARPLREAIDAAFRGNAPATLPEVAVEDLLLGEPRYLRVECLPQPAAGEPDGPAELALVVVNDLTDQVRARRALEARLAATTADLEERLATATAELEGRLATAFADLERARREHAAETARREALIGRLGETSRQLLEANQELHATAEELRATSEEFQLSTEEAQAAAEEAETLNEELQATNEELETLNEELQATVEELNTTNDELQARSGELSAVAHESEERRAWLEAVLAGMGDAVLVVDEAGRPLLHNAAYRRLFGPPDAPLAPLDSAGRPLPAGEDPRARLARGEEFAMEFLLDREDGAFRWFEAAGAPIPGAGARQAGVLVIRDITERSLHRLQDEFMALASHELRTPLTLVRGYADVLALALGRADAGGADLERLRSYAERISVGTHRLQRLVADLTDIARLQGARFAVERAPLRLDAVVLQAVEVARTLAGGRAIALAGADEALPVLGDAGRLEQVLLNLLSNALTHAPGDAPIAVTLRRAGGEAVVAVRDAGPGIPPDELPRIFARFHQVAREARPGGGLGLGLYIARAIVDTHGGSITAESTPGQGSTFTVRLPLATDHAGEGAAELIGDTP